MAGQTIILCGPSQRQNAHRLIDLAGDDFVVNIKEPTRNISQNDKMWAMLSDVSRAKIEGRQWTTDTWKAAFMQSLGHQCRFAEGLDNSGPFPVGFRTSRLSVREMADLITVIYEFGDRHGVQWTGPREMDA